MPQKIGSWEYKLIPALNGGLNISVRSDQLEDNELLTALGIMLRKDQIEIDTGYIKFSDTVAGTPQATYQFFRNNGTAELVCVSTESFYRYNTTHKQWQVISDGTDTTVAVQAVATDTDITVVDDTGFDDGDLIGITLDNGFQHKTTVNGTPVANVIAFDDPIPAGRTADVGDAVVRAITLSGSDDEHVAILTVPSHDWCVFTNNEDPIMRYDGTTVEVLPGQPSGGNFRCRWIALYNNALFAVNTEEGGTQHPQRVYRSESGDPTIWSGGTAGYDDLYDEADFNMCCEVLGPYLIVYRERSIARGEFLGSGGLNYKFDTVLRGEGVFSSSMVTDLGDKHVFVGNTNIYAYRGGFDIEPLGDKVFYKLFGSSSLIDSTNRHRSFVVYVEELDEIWMMFPKAGSEHADYTIRFLVAEESYAEREFAHTFRGYGFYQKGNSLTWDDLVGTWDEQTWQWDSRMTLGAAPTTHLCSSDTGQVYEYDFLASLDDTAPIGYTVETKDFELAGMNFRFDMWEADLNSSGTLVEYSVDGGQTWATLGTVSANTRQRVRLFKQFLGDRIRYRLTGQGTFAMGWMAFDYKQESLW